MRYVFIINPEAGKGNGPKTIIPKIKQYFGDRKDVSIYVTEYPGQSFEIAKAEADKGDSIRIFACGGEGTCFEVLNGVFGRKNVELGVIPCGSANDFLKFYGDKELFCDVSELVNGTAMPIDAIKADEFYCINGCSVGMDAMVADNMKIFKRWPFVSGSMAYKFAVMKTFFKKIGLKLKVTINGVSKGYKNCLFVVCANGPVYGGGYKAAPYAVPDDGELDFTVVNSIKKVQVPEFLKLYAKGKHIVLPYCELGRCGSVEIEANSDIPINLDGEIIHRSKIKFEIIKNAVNFVFPQVIVNKFLKNKKFSKIT